MSICLQCQQGFELQAAEREFLKKQRLPLQGTVLNYLTPSSVPRVADNDGTLSEMIVIYIKELVTKRERLLFLHFTPIKFFRFMP